MVQRLLILLPFEDGEHIAKSSSLTGNTGETDGAGGSGGRSVTGVGVGCGMGNELGDPDCILVSTGEGTGAGVPGAGGSGRLEGC